MNFLPGKEEHDIIRAKDKDTHDAIADALRQCPLFTHMPDDAVEKMVGLGAQPTLRMQLQPGPCPFSVLGFWGKMTMPNAGTMAYRRDFPSTTRI